MTVIPYRGGCLIISKVSVSESQLNPHERQFTKRLRLAIACLKTTGIYVLSVMQCRCLDHACRLFDCS